MNSIKFLIGIVVIGITLAGFILMDPAFKSSLNHGVQGLSSVSSGPSIEKPTVSTESVTLNLAH